MERCCLEQILSVRVGAMFEQWSEESKIAARRSVMQERILPLASALVGISTTLKQEPCDVDMPGFARDTQTRLAVDFG